MIFKYSITKHFSCTIHHPLMFSLILLYYCIQKTDYYNVFLCAIILRFCSLYKKYQRERFTFYEASVSWCVSVVSWKTGGMVSIRHRVITFVTFLRFNQAKSMRNEWMKRQRIIAAWRYRDKGKKDDKKNGAK